MWNWFACSHTKFSQKREIQCHNNLEQTSNAKISTTKNELLCFHLDRNSDKVSSTLDGQIDPVRKFFSAKIAEYDAMRATSNKCNVNFVFKPAVTSHDEEIHDMMKAFTSELCKVGNLAKNI